MTFGFRNAGQTFQRYINKALGDLDFVYLFVDDILVASSSPEEHESHLKLILEHFDKFHLRLNVKKCTFGLTELVFLSHLVNADGFKPPPEKVEAVKNFPKPRNIDELRRFLGMINFYRRCLPNVAKSQLPLNAYLSDARKKDKRPINWTPEAEAAFEKCKNDLANVALLAFPDESAEIRVTTDASDTAMGAALEQSNDGSWRPLAFFSRKFSPAQSRYPTIDRELTAIYEAVRYFHYYLEGREFTIYTDHKPLTYLMQQSQDRAPVRRLRQLEYISQYSTQIKYLPGADNHVADSLSRIEAFTLPTMFDWSDPTLTKEPKVKQVLAHIDAFRFPVLFDIKQLSEEQSKDEQLKEIVQNPDHPLKLIRLTWGSEHTPFWCDILDSVIRAYIPESMRKEVFELFHAPAHPSAKVTDRLIRQQYVWPKMSRDIAKWCRTCLPCQESKISRHNKFLPSHFIAPDGRFTHVHIDIVGPLPTSDGYNYILTMIDRYSRWPEAAPLMETSAESVARAFYDTWVSRYGAPEIVTSDQGSQFESQLFKALLNLIGCKRIRTTAYHPASNGMVERWHRDLKAAIMCQTDSPDWSRCLSTVLLGLRTRLRLDTEASPADFVFGTPLRVPGEFCAFGSFEPNPQYFLEEFREYIKQVRPVPVAHKHKISPFVYKDLATCTHVFLLGKPVKRPLERPYTGPHKVLERINDFTYSIEVNGEPKIVSTERLKPAHYVPEDLPDIMLGPQEAEPSASIDNNVCDKADIGKSKIVISDDTMINNTHKNLPNHSDPQPDSCANDDTIGTGVNKHVSFGNPLTIGKKKHAPNILRRKNKQKTASTEPCGANHTNAQLARDSSQQGTINGGATPRPILKTYPGKAKLAFTQ